MTLTSSSRLVVPDSVVIKTFDDGESVLLNLDSEQYYGLDPVGSRMWELFATSPSIDAAYAILLEEYAVEPDVLRHDMEALLADLLDHGLVTLDATQPAD